MRTPMILTLTALAVVTIISLTSCSKKDDSSETSAASSNETRAAHTKINDPDGVYNFFNDPSISSHPPEGFVTGKGQVVEIKYDGSKGGDILSYQLYYLDKNGSVHPMGGGTFENKGDGLYSRDIIVYNSAADKHPGFLEVTTVVGAGMQDGKINYGKNVKLGMYPIRFEVSQ